MRRRIGAGVAILATITTVITGVSKQATFYDFNPNKAYEIAATRDIAYQAVPVSRPGTGWGVARGLNATINHMHDRLEAHADKGFRIRIEGEWGPTRNLNPTLQRVHELMDHWPVYGEAHVTKTVLVVRANEDLYKEWMRKIDRNPAKIINTEGTRAIDIIVGTTITRFPTIHSVGIYVCKYIAGTRTLSQHSYGNAWDIVAPTYTLDAVARFQLALKRKGYLPLSQLIWRGRDMISGRSVYDHYNHIHDTGSPLMSGGCRRPG